MRILKIYILALLLPIIGFAQQEKVTEVLFVGNSFTYFWNMPQMVEAMAKHQNVALKTSRSTIGASNLEHHWKEEKGTQTRSLLEKKKWDYVVLQDHSLSTIKSPKRWEEYNRKFVDLLRNKGVEPVLYSTWAYKSNPLMQSKISESYKKMGDQLNLKVIPVGSVFALSRNTRPDLELFFDNKHPSSNGSYLVALVFYKFFTGLSVDPLPNRLETIDANGNKIYLSFIKPENGNFLRQLVDDFPMTILKSSH